MRYDASASFLPELNRLKQLPGVQILSYCPELLGGLSCPRPPAEIVSHTPLKIATRDHLDVTEAFVNGAHRMLQMLAEQTSGVDLVILKDNSPSCGVGQIYDGSFSRQLIQGDGVCAQLLRAQGYRVCSQRDLVNLIAWIDNRPDGPMNGDEWEFLQANSVMQALMGAFADDEEWAAFPETACHSHPSGIEAAQQDFSVMGRLSAAINEPFAAVRQPCASVSTMYRIVSYLSAPSQA